MDRARGRPGNAETGLIAFPIFFFGGGVLSRCGRALNDDLSGPTKALAASPREPHNLKWGSFELFFLLP